MRLYKWPALRLAFVPGLLEAFFDGGLAILLFGMPPALGFALGFILKAVGPGLVVPAMFQLQKLGLGADKGVCVCVCWLFFCVGFACVMGGGGGGHTR
jgi:NhaP-type Na+/H+ or K+/H+ antiporter